MASVPSPTPSDPASVAARLRAAIGRGDLRTAIAIRREQSLELLAAIARRIEAQFPATGASDSKTWADQGSLAHVVELLGETARFLGAFPDESAMAATLGGRP